MNWIIKKINERNIVLNENKKINRRFIIKIKGCSKKYWLSLIIILRLRWYWFRGFIKK